MAKLGWVEGRNLRLDLRFGAGDAERRAYAAELVNLGPDVIVAAGAPATLTVQEKTQTIPIVMIGGGDVFATGVVKNIAHPEGNVTGVTNLFGSIGGKWLELLKEAVPRLERVAYIHRVLANSRESYLPSIAEAARVLNVQAIDIPFRLGDAVELMRGIDAFAADPGGGLILHPGVAPYQETILMLAAQHRLPTVVGGVRGKEGALIAYYGSTAADLVRRVAFFGDRLSEKGHGSRRPTARFAVAMLWPSVETRA
jgi:putative tryptophan/tyrosine transport system substrate-binding protein